MLKFERRRTPVTKMDHPNESISSPVVMVEEYPVIKLLYPPPVTQITNNTHHFDDLEMTNLKMIQNLISKLKILEYKMAILEPQYPINGRNHAQTSSKLEKVKEACRRAMLLTTGHGVPSYMRSDRIAVRALSFNDIF